MFNILILGAGLSGLAASIGLRRKGYRVTVLERTTAIGQEGIGGYILIPPNAARVLVSYGEGLWGRLVDVSVQTDTHTIYKGDGTAVLDLVDHLGMQRRHGYRMVSIHRARYQQILYETALRVGVEVRLGTTFDHIDERTCTVTLNGRKEMRADVIVGADGINSKVRTLVLGHDRARPIPEHVIYQCLVDRHVMEQDPLTRPLMTGGQHHSWWGSYAHMITGPHDDVYSFAMTDVRYQEPDVSEGANMVTKNGGTDTQMKQMNDCAMEFEPKVRAFIGMTKPEDFLLWKLADLPDLETWVSPGGRVTLLGDASHAMTPHLGQGAATAMEDGGVLAECLGRAKSTSDIPTALHTYEKVRKQRCDRVKALARTSGAFKAIPGGPNLQKRDKMLLKRMDRANPDYEFWRASGSLDWIYEHDCLKAANQELDKAFGTDPERMERARI